MMISNNLLANKTIPEWFYVGDPSSPTDPGRPWWVLCGGGTCNLTPLQFVSVLLPNILIIAGVIFFLLILGGGFMMISGAGKESSAQDKAKANAAVTYGLIGFLLVIASFFILQIISLVTGIDFVKSPI